MTLYNCHHHLWLLLLLVRWLQCSRVHCCSYGRVLQWLAEHLLLLMESAGMLLLLLLLQLLLHLLVLLLLLQLLLCCLYIVARQPRAIHQGGRLGTG
jgi:hypothetical protein